MADLLQNKTDFYIFKDSKVSGDPIEDQIFRH